VQSVEPSEIDPIPAALAGTPVPKSVPQPPLGAAAGADIAQFIAVRAAACVGADYSNFALVRTDAPAVLRLYHGTFFSATRTGRYIDIALDAPYPIAEAVRQRSVLLLNGEADYVARFPDLWADTAAAGVAATVCVPLWRGDGSIIGAIGFAWTIAPRFDVKLDRALEALAHLVTEIVERSELYAAEHQLIADLHRRLLSDLPAMDGLATAARYLPAGESSSIGGDWFEGLHLDGSRWAVVVGDVTGHGLPAAADMALIRGLITALLHDGVPAADVFERVSRILARRADGVLATAAVAVVDTAAATLTYATAGHPPPLLLQPGGTVTRLGDANAPLLGVPSSRQAARTAAFPRGSTLIMYTDGLVERPDRPFDEGIDRAVALLQQVGQQLGPEQYVDLLVSGLVGDRSEHDDVAVVVLQHRG